MDLITGLLEGVVTNSTKSTVNVSCSDLDSNRQINCLSVKELVAESVKAQAPRGESTGSNPGESRIMDYYHRNSFSKLTSTVIQPKFLAEVTCT